MGAQGCCQNSRQQPFSKLGQLATLPPRLRPLILHAWEEAGKASTMRKTLLVSVTGWVVGAIVGMFLLGQIQAMQPETRIMGAIGALLGGGTLAIVAALASVGADLVVAIKQINPFVLESPAEPPHPVDAFRAGKPPN
jgi:hypothetical protein